MVLTTLRDEMIGYESCSEVEPVLFRVFNVYWSLGSLPSNMERGLLDGVDQLTQ
jgi:hypothetical protein